MSNTMKKKGFMPMFPGMNALPPMPFMPPMPDQDFWGFNKGGRDDRKEQWDDFKSNLESYWNQLGEMQDSTMEASKEQWNRFFDQILEMQDIFTASLPDEIPALPWLPAWFTPSMSPRAFMEKVKEFQEMAKAHAVEQADSFLDFCKKGQQQAKTMVSEAVKDVEDKVEKVDRTVQEAEKPEKEADKAENKADEPEKEADKAENKADKPVKKADKPVRKTVKSVKKNNQTVKKTDETEKSAGEVNEGAANNVG